MMVKQEKFVILKGVTITWSDRRILKGTFFLTDNIIEFYFKFLELTYGKDDAEDQFVLVSPSISFLLASFGDDHEQIKQIVDELKLHEKKLVLFTINNQEENQETDEGGTHWSLLIYYRPINKFIHHDSVKGLNDSHAKKLYMAVKDFVRCRNSNVTLDPTTTLRQDGPSLIPRPLMMRRFDHKFTREEVRFSNHNRRPRKRNNTSETRHEPSYIEFWTPQHSNLYDCGLFVMKIAAVVCEWFVSNERHRAFMWSGAVENQVRRFYVEENMRSDILELIDLWRIEGCDL